MNGKKIKQKSIIGWIMEYSKTKRKSYIASVIFAVLGVICAMMPYYFISQIIVKLLSGEKHFDAYATYFLLIGVFWTLRVIFHSVSTGMSHKATFNVLANIRLAMCRKLTRIPLGDVKSMPSGALKSIMVERVDSMETTLAHILPEFTANLLAPVMVFAYICTFSWKLALATLITLPAGMICMMFMMKDTEWRWEDCIKKTKILNDTAVEYINGIEVIKVFGKTDSSYAKFEKATHDGAYCYIDWMRATITPFTAGLSITPATILSILPIGSFMFMSGGISAADFITIIILSIGMLLPLITVMSYFDDISKINVIFGEVADILEMKEMKRPETTLKQSENNDISLKNVRFGYEDEKEVLHGIDLEIKEGTVTALVGPSGSGKSTVARLISALWDVDDGTITIGGVDIRNISYEDYVKRIAYVSQDNYLFNTTVMENIRMGRKSATDSEVIEAAKSCGCHEFIESLENGYNTVTGDSGGHLSGGERQRISIVRAMLKDAPVVILDEATAYTDPESEALIQKSIGKMIQNKTLIVIAHRLSTIVDADKIVVIDDGKINSQGTHQKLLAEGGLYTKMWNAHISARDTVNGGEMNV